ncbi:ABC transporter permease [bacterium]|nr:ABC transporter permease [bacterium]
MEYNHKNNQKILFKSPGLARRILSWLSIYTSENDALGDFEEEFERLLKRDGVTTARRWYWINTMITVGPYLKQIFFRSIMMQQNTLKTTFRNLLRHKTFSLINLTGLALGLASCLFIMYYLNHQISFDRHHPDSDRIYRVALEIDSNAGAQQYAINAPPVAAELMDNFPQVEVAGRVFLWFNQRVVRYEDRIFEEAGFVYADNSIFQILSVPFLEGDPATALTAPNSLVIPERLARKYFGENHAVGRSLNLDGFDYKITGVTADAPDRTHLPVDLFLSMEDLNNLAWMQDWTWPGMWTYVKLKAGSDADAFALQIEAIADEHLAGDNRVAGKTYRNILQPVKDIYLNSSMEYEFVTGNRFNLILFGAVGLFILAIACINFINLTTARSATRAKEIGLRKTAGATRSRIIWQFLGETWTLTLIAVVGAFILIVSSQSLFTDLTGVTFIWAQFFSPAMICGMLVLLILVCVLAGGYPALCMSRFTPMAMFRGKSELSSSKSWLRRLLVVFQFAVAIILIAGTLIVREQLSFIQNTSLGFDKKDKLIMSVRGRRPLEGNYQSVKAALARHAGIIDVAATSQVPGRGAGSLQTRILGQADDHGQMMSYYFIDESFLKLFDIQIKSGRAFRFEQSTDIDNSCIINETAVKAFGWTSATEAIGKRLETGLEGKEKEIVGVVSDFHYRDLRNVIEPLVIECEPQMFGQLVLSFEHGNRETIIKVVEKEWLKLFPDKPFQYQYIEDILGSAYADEQRTGRMFSLFSFMGVFIACLGLLGLSAFMAQRRLKEIGVRKVLGSSVSGIVWLLTREFSKWVLISNIIAWPITYWIMNKWLMGFSYRADLNVMVFIYAGGSAFLIAWLTAAFQSVKAARRNPIESLKCE